MAGVNTALAQDHGRRGGSKDLLSVLRVILLSPH